MLIEFQTDICFSTAIDLRVEKITHLKEKKILLCIESVGVVESMEQYMLGEILLERNLREKNLGAWWTSC